MPVNTWWYDDPAEIYFMETTDRRDLGVDLRAPVADDAGHAHHAYALVPYVRNSDIVFHYLTTPGAIVGWSRVVGEPFTEELVWGARGRVAQKAGVKPYLRPHCRVGLEGPFMLRSPVSREELQHRETAIRKAIETTEAVTRGSIYRPFQLSYKQPMRGTQHYLTKVPVSLVRAIPSLAEAVALKVPGDTRNPGRALARPHPVGPIEGSELGQHYIDADEQAADSQRDPFSVDPTVIDRGVRGHAKTQNALAAWVRLQDHDPRSPRSQEPQYDLGWSAGTTVWIAEVKSLTRANEERQLRLGLGQVLRYRHVLGAGSDAAVRAVLAVEKEPVDSSWRDLCRQLDVILCWPPDFAGLVNA
jgi:hypothetical protein